MEPVTAAIISAAVTLVVTVVAIKVERSLSFVSPDVHKPHKPKIPKSVGWAIFPGILAGVLAGGDGLTNYLLPHLAAVGIAALIGFLDDIKSVSPVAKVLLFLLPALPVIAAGAYIPRLYVPALGVLRVTIIYPLAVLVGYTVSANAFNMADTHNGIAPSIALVALSVAALGSALLKGCEPLPGYEVFLASSLAALAVYLPFNFYPAKAFNGNSGSHMMGALVASAAILSRREYLMVMVLSPLVINSFSILASIRGLKQKERIERPVVIKGNLLLPSRSKKAPVTLVQLFLLLGPMTEKGVITYYLILMGMSAVVSFVLYYLLSTLAV